MNVAAETDAAVSRTDASCEAKRAIGPAEQVQAKRATRAKRMASGMFGCAAQKLRNEYSKRSAMRRGEEAKEKTAMGQKEVETEKRIMQAVKEN